MRVVGSTVLVLQALVLMLALPVALQVNGTSAGIAWPAFVAVALLCIVATGVITRPIGVRLGWVAQVATAALAWFVPWLLLLAVVFSVLWWAAIRAAAKVVAAQAARNAAQPDQ